MKQGNNHYTVLKNYNPKPLLLSNAVFISMLMLATLAIAEETPDLTKPKIVVPEKIAGVKTVTAEEVIEILTTENPPILIDARIRNDREYGHIESSISLPDINTNCGTLSEVTTDKNQHLMFYCNGVKCGRSVVSIKVARSCGYHNLTWFKGGFTEWKDKGYQYEKMN